MRVTGVPETYTTKVTGISRVEMRRETKQLKTSGKSGVDFGVKEPFVKFRVGF